MNTLIEKAKKIQLMIFDVDGVLTAGTMSYGKDGIEAKHFNAHDGQGIRHLLKTGVAVVSLLHANLRSLNAEWEIEVLYMCTNNNTTSCWPMKT